MNAAEARPKVARYVDAVRNFAGSIASCLLGIQRSTLSKDAKVRAVEELVALVEQTLEDECDRALFTEALRDHLGRQDEAGRAFFAHVEAEQRKQMVERLVRSLKQEA